MKNIKLATLFLVAGTVQAGPIACQVDGSDYSNPPVIMMGAPGPIKQFHVKGKHQCWSRTNAGYWCDVENRDSSDCGSGHIRNRNDSSCCQTSHFQNDPFSGMLLPKPDSEVCPRERAWRQYCNVRNKYETPFRKKLVPA